MKRPTIRDVAQRAGVSISAVSYILNGSDKKKYAPETVERVRQAAQALAYVPSSIARSMRARQAHTLGVVTYWSMGERVFVKLLEGIVARAARENYAVLLCPQGAQLEYYQNGRMDGVIYVAPPSGNRLCEEEADVRAMREAGIPCVIIHGQSRLPDVNYLYFDFYNAIEALVSYLTDQGYREITYVAPEPDGAADGPELTERLRGYTETMRARGLAPDVCPDTRIAERMPDFRAEGRALFRRVSGRVHARNQRHGGGKGAADVRPGLPADLHHHLDRPRPRGLSGARDALPGQAVYRGGRRPPGGRNPRPHPAGGQIPGREGRRRRHSPELPAHRLRRALLAPDPHPHAREKDADDAHAV